MHLSKKIYILRFNDNPFMTKALRKALMHRSKLKIVFHKTRAKEDWNNCKRTKKPVADAGGCHCCQCSTPKWLTLIFRVEFSFLKMLRIRFSNLTKSSYGRHCSETLTSVGEDTIFLFALFLAQFAILCNVLSVLASFPTTNIQIF